MDLIAAAALRLFLWFFGLLPHNIRVSIFSFVFRLAYLIVPKLRRSSLINLKQAFPDRDPSWYDQILRENQIEIARLLADAVRLPKLDRKWVEEHVSIPALPRYEQVLSGGKGVVIATGHLGSFELLGHAIGLMGSPLAVVVRNFKLPKVDNLWRTLREARGNTVIGRRGAFKEIVHNISDGRSVAVLFDQNVTRNHAVFVNLFGRPAATTKAVALAAIRTEAPVFVASMRYMGNDRYTVESVECDFRKLYDDSALSIDAKVEHLTQVLSDEYAKMIEKFPQGWFWMHRRWKTTPEGVEENFYDGR